jgi:hypothetical protein
MSEGKVEWTEHDVEALLAKVPPTVAARIRQSRFCMNFLQNRNPVTADTYMLFLGAGKTEDQLEPEERELLAALRTYEAELLPEPWPTVEFEDEFDDDDDRRAALDHN